jgi:hypothetical protein
MMASQQSGALWLIGGTDGRNMLGIWSIVRRRYAALTVSSFHWGPMNVIHHILQSGRNASNDTHMGWQGVAATLSRQRHGVATACFSCVYFFSGIAHQGYDQYDIRAINLSAKHTLALASWLPVSAYG